jgi:hypothetical protein
MSIVSKLADFGLRGVHFDSLYLPGQITPGKIQYSLHPSRLGTFRRHQTQTCAMFPRPATKRQTNIQTNTENVSGPLTQDWKCGARFFSDFRSFQVEMRILFKIYYYGLAILARTPFFKFFSPIQKIVELFKKKN